MANNRAPNWVRGAVAGIVGAVAYTIFVEAVNVASNGLGAFFFPFRQIGAVILGSGALSADYNLLIATVVGTIVHFAIAAAFGVMISLIWARSTALGAVGVIVLGLVAGLAFYALNVFVIFPAAFPWFLSNDRLTQSLGHALFGAVTAAWLARP